LWRVESWAVDWDARMAGHLAEMMAENWVAMRAAHWVCWKVALTDAQMVAGWVEHLDARRAVPRVLRWAATKAVKKVDCWVDYWEP
jgi:hypothetical protein